MNHSSHVLKYYKSTAYTVYSSFLFASIVSSNAKKFRNTSNTCIPNHFKPICESLQNSVGEKLPACDVGCTSLFHTSLWKNEIPVGKATILRNTNQ